jgi:hypothetical protein
MSCHELEMTCHELEMTSHELEMTCHELKALRMPRVVFGRIHALSLILSVSLLLSHPSR